MNYKYNIIFYVKDILCQFEFKSSSSNPMEVAEQALEHLKESQNGIHIKAFGIDADDALDYIRSGKVRKITKVLPLDLN